MLLAGAKTFISGILNGVHVHRWLVELIFTFDQGVSSTA